MILLIFAILISAVVFTAEVPAYIRYRDEADFLLMVMSGLMLLSCVVVLFFWRMT